SAAKAREAAERLRSAIENTSFDADGVRVSTTASIGIATYPDEVEDVNQLMEKADEALYVSKTVGRNAVTAYSMIMQAEMTGVEQGNESEPGQSGSMT
ncbi:MAG: diguanylate cyclase, partial [Methylophaga sp.]